MLDARQKELEEGLSLRGLARRFDQHLVNSATAHAELEARVRDLERSDATQTGRFQIPPMTVPTVPTKIELTRSSSKRPTTIGPILKAISRTPYIKWGLIVATIIGSNLLGRCGITLPPPPAVPAAPAH